MRRITPNSKAEHEWPRQTVASIETRKRDLVIRIADWTRQSIETGEPAYDVEVYVGGVYDWNESRSFTFNELKDEISDRKHTKERCKDAAIRYAGEAIARLL